VALSISVESVTLPVARKRHSYPLRLRAVLKSCLREMRPLWEVHCSMYQPKVVKHAATIDFGHVGSVVVS
jgi:hypothetical protein